MRWREAAAASDEYFDRLRTELQSGRSKVDVIGGDVIWPAQLAANGWILDLSDRFTEDMSGDHLDGPLELVARVRRASGTESGYVFQGSQVAALGRESLENTRPRPVSPYCSDMSLAMADKFNAGLKDDLPVERALAELQNIVDQS